MPKSRVRPVNQANTQIKTTSYTIGSANKIQLTGTPVAPGGYFNGPTQASHLQQQQQQHHLQNRSNVTSRPDGASVVAGQQASRKAKVLREEVICLPRSVLERSQAINHIQAHRDSKLLQLRCPSHKFAMPKFYHSFSFNPMGESVPQETIVPQAHRQLPQCSSISHHYHHHHHQEQLPSWAIQEQWAVTMVIPHLQDLPMKQSPPLANGKSVMMVTPCKNLGDTSGLLAPHTESSRSIATWSTLIQVMLAFLIAGFGNVGAGLILDYVKEWPVFLHVDELFILVPSLLGLKGNLEMTMASRLSTQANLGHMDNSNKLLEMAKGNLALVQCQATVVSLSVAIFASLIKSISLQSAGSQTAGVEADEVDEMVAANSLAATTIARINATGNNNNNSNDSALLSTIGLVDEAAAANDKQASNSGGGGGGGGGGPIVERQMNGFDWDNALILCASSLLTANIACFVLGTMMILVIVGSHKVNIDPDNIASPVAASLGDMTTAALLAVIAHSIYQYSESQRMPYLALIITLLFVGMLPVWISVARNNPYTSDVITKGWTPIVIAVFISSCGGFILEHGKSRFSRLPIFQPVINGVGGNLVAVQASRLSTSLHRLGKPGQLPNDFRLFSGPVELFLTKRNDVNMTTARLLLLMSVPAHLLYFFVIRAIEGGDSATLPVTAVFLGFYMLLAVLQVALLLYLAQNLVNLLWRCKVDPDNYSTPILTATGDLLGCAFLLIVFVIAYQFNDPYAMTTV